jgi:hypothetical protein
MPSNNSRYEVNIALICPYIEEKCRGVKGKANGRDKAEIEWGGKKLKASRSKIEYF